MEIDLFKKQIKASLWPYGLFEILEIVNFQTVHFSQNKLVQNEHA